MFYRPFILVIVLGLSGSLASAERPFALIKPNTGTETNYRFDVNNIPVGDETSVSPADLNFPPNIIFTPDSQKGFVTFPGSDKILAFRPSTGEILATIATSSNPTTLALTPDGKRLAVPCMFLKDNTTVIGDVIGKEIGAINIIDVETYEVKTLNLTKVFFSFANNIVFSGDSKTGFVASSKTDEILRFDVATAQEIEPRLDMPPGSRPASLAMSPDFSYFTVVLTGWRVGTTLIRDDNIGVIDPQSFQVARWVEMKFEDKEIKPDFQAVNTVAFTKDGKLGLVADQLSSTIVSSPLTEDRAILFEPATGKVVKVFNTGNLPGSAYTTPDGLRFILIGEVYVTIIDAAKQEVATDTPIHADFKPGNQPGFSPDGKRMFISAPMSDHLLVFSLDTGEVLRIIDVGTLINPLTEDDPLAKKTCSQNLLDGTCTAAPLNPAMTPDGKILASINFNANTIDLIGDSLNFGIPTLFSYPPPTEATDTTPHWFTGLAFTNNSSTTEATIKTNAYSWAGILYQDEDSTTDVTEYTNPNTITLAPGAQKAFTAADLLKPSSGKSVEGWLDVDSNIFETGSFFMVGDAALKRLDGAPAFMQIASTVVIPEVRVLDGFRTELSVFNYSWTQNSAILKLYNDQGALLYTSESLVLQGGMEITRFVKAPDGTAGVSVFFPDSAFENFTSGYVVVESRYPVIALERYYDAERMSILYGFPKGTGFNTANRLFIPQVATFAGSETFLNLVNIGTETATVTAVLKDNNGTGIGLPATFQIEPGKRVRRSIAEIFQLADNGSPVSGWIQVDADKPGLVGNAEIRTYAGKAMTTLTLTPSGGKKLSFSHVAQGLGYSTGISLLNPGAVAATAQIDIVANDGTLVAGKQVTIPAGGRLVNMLTDQQLFPTLQETIGGYIRVTSDQELIGVEIFFSDNLELLSLVPGQVVQE
ncbi:MAG: YncE family protein [Acidobacteriota bacterium]